MIIFFILRTLCEWNHTVCIKPSEIGSLTHNNSPEILPYCCASVVVVVVVVLYFVLLGSVPYGYTTVC